MHLLSVNAHIYHVRKPVQSPIKILPLNPIDHLYKLQSGALKPGMQGTKYCTFTLFKDKL